MSGKLGRARFHVQHFGLWDATTTYLVGPVARSICALFGHHFSDTPATRSQTVLLRICQRRWCVTVQEKADDHWKRVR